MVDRTLATAIFCVCAALLAVLLRQHCREQSMLLAIAACGAVIGGAFAYASPLISDIRDIFDSAGISESYIALIFKAAAVCLITQITCELCRDCGESAIASAAEIWGRGAVAYLTIPLVRTLIGQISGFLQAER